MEGPGRDAYVDRLMQVLTVPTARDKAELLGQMLLPPDQARWQMPDLPARPGRPTSYRESSAPPRRRRTLTHAPTRNRFLLAIHHIELSAIDLAVVACLRGSGLPSDFHRDFLGIARDEARHAGLLEALLGARGLHPGDEPVHYRLWESTRACRDLGEHLVVVPRVLEARGLDVSAELLPRLLALDGEAHAVLQVIYDDEIGHVALGTRWQHWWCREQGSDPFAYFSAVLAHHFPGPHPWPTPLDLYGRQQAGFSAAELRLLGNADRCMSRACGGQLRFPVPIVCPA
jgi:uncharacterized ferritin-like protein (DUF455 family)